MKRTKKNNIKQYMEKGDILRKLSRLYSKMNKKNKKQIELL